MQCEGNARANNAKINIDESRIFIFISEQQNEFKRPRKLSIEEGDQL